MKNLFCAFYVALFLMALPIVAAAYEAPDVQPMHIRVSSFASGGDRVMFDGNRINDGNFDTSWRSNSFGDGTGQWIQLFFPDEVVVDSIFIRNGEGSGKSFKRFNRVKNATMIYSDREQQEIVVADSENLQTFTPLRKVTTSLSLVLDKVYPGTDNSTSAIAEYYVSYHRPDDKERQQILAIESARAAELKRVQAEVADSSKDNRHHAKKRDADDKLLTHDEAQKVFAEFFDKFYSSFVTLNDAYPRMYAESEYMRESIFFDSFKYSIEQRGVLKYYQDSMVDTHDLKIEIITLRKREADVKVSGFYDVVFNLKLTTMPEDSKYHLVKEYGKWKVAEKVENPF